MRLLLTPILFFSLTTEASANDGLGTMQVAKWSMVTLCFMIGIIGQIASGALSGETRLNWGQLLARLFAVILFVESAGRIQGFIWGSAEQIGNSVLPGPTLVDLNVGFAKRVKSMKAKTVEAEENVTLGGIITDPKLMFNLLADATMQVFEHISLTIFFVSYKLLQSAQKVVMMFLAGMAPLILPASIIPGINIWSSWLKMVISVALWPVVAGFMIKGQFMSTSAWLGGGIGGEGAVTGMFSSDIGNFFLNMDSLQLFAQSIFYAMMLFASPFLASGLVYGSGHALALGASVLMTKPAMAAITGSGNLMSRTFGSHGIFAHKGGRGKGRENPSMNGGASSETSLHDTIVIIPSQTALYRPALDRPMSARYSPPGGGAS